jgi:hypothetical protein
MIDVIWGLHRPMPHDLLMEVLTESLDTEDSNKGSGSLNGYLPSLYGHQRVEFQSPPTIISRAGKIVMNVQQSLRSCQRRIVRCQQPGPCPEVTHVLPINQLSAPWRIIDILTTS